MGHVDHGVRLGEDAVGQLDVAVEEDPLPGTSTSSKTTTASISSNREPSGWSKCERPMSNDSRQMNFSPGVSHGMAKAKV